MRMGHSETRMEVNATQRYQFDVCVNGSMDMKEMSSAMCPHICCTYSIQLGGLQYGWAKIENNVW
jgi:hypothetical protein